MSRNLRALYTGLSPNWATNPELFAVLNAEFGFDFDPCQINDSSIWDGTAVSWAGKRVFCNPPYGRGMGAWLAKGREAEISVFLVPARTDTAWWHEHALKADEIRFIRGRLMFSKGGIRKPDGPSNARGSAPFPSALIIYRADSVTACLRVREAEKRLRLLDNTASALEGVAELTPEILKGWLAERRQFAAALASPEAHD